MTLAQPARDAARVVVITGAESTGKSALAAAIAQQLGVPLALEFAREYAERASRPLTAADVEPIAMGQRALEDAAIARAGGGLAVLDTDLRSTIVYAQYYYPDAELPTWLPAAVAARLPALYLICETDIPWVRDPVRDSAEARQALQQRLAAVVRQSGAPVVTVRGALHDRLQSALSTIASLRR